MIINKKLKINNLIFYTVLLLFIIISVVATFVRIVIQKKYQIVAETSCNPANEKCFVRVCDPVDDNTCPETEIDRKTYYKLISKSAANISICESSIDKIGCNHELSCIPYEVSCEYTFCNTDNLPDGESCVN